ncbi:hypothetical protein A2U01_0011925 [Trifolium medium]|uniref:Uncharacterized protein n=1 Tax=Trifolium medium TaxID=97028 RepID=A0A392MU48_9FABA|nr:hypothetical protein [Trifolium medium]
MHKDLAGIITNFIGIALQLSYLAIFLWYATPNFKVYNAFEMQTFDVITKGNDFDEKRFLRHPLAENLSNRLLKSIRKVIRWRKIELQIAVEEVVVDKTKKKWTLKEDEAIEADIARTAIKSN